MGGWWYHLLRRGRLEDKQVRTEKNKKCFCFEKVKFVILFILLVEYQVGSYIFKIWSSRKGHTIGHIYLRVNGIWMAFKSMISISGEIT